MKVLSIVLFLGLTSVCYADRVCLEKSTGKLIEYQSGNAELGTLTKNAESSGYKKEDVEEKYVTAKEWLAIEEEQIKEPAREKAKQEKLIKHQKEVEIKTVLNLSDENWQKLKDVLNGN